MSTWVKVLISAFLLVLGSTAPQARDLTFSLGHPPGSFFAQGAEAFARALEEETGGHLKARVFPMSLLSMAETSAGVRDGLADIGAVMITYHAAEYPHTNLILDSSLLVGSSPGELPVGAAYAAAVTEFVYTKCPECLGEFGRQNQVFLGGAGSSRYTLNCRKALTSLADLQGARLRVGGASWARWAEAVGATPVTMAGDEMLQALSQGLLDCVVLSIPDVRNFGLLSTVEHVTEGIPGGVYVAAFASMNRDSWLALNPDEKRAILKAVANGAALTSWLYHQGEKDVLDQLVRKGGQVHRPNKEVSDLTAKFVRDDGAALSRLYSERGVTRGPEMQEDFRQILDRWLVLAKDVASAEELADLYTSELFLKLSLPEDASASRSP